MNLPRPFTVRNLCTVSLAAALAALLALPGTNAAAEDDGWVSLTEGDNLDQWMSADGSKPAAGWSIEDGVVSRTARAGDLWTKERFGNFVLSLEYKTEGNSGVFFRTDETRNNVQTGIEVQVDNPAAEPNKHTPGALYDLVAPSEDNTKAGAWNKMVITAKGPHVTVEMNGTKVVEADLDKWTTANMNPDGTKNKFKNALKDFVREGHIGLQEHGHNVSYRNIMIKPLD